VCKSTVRARSIVHLLSIALFGHSLILRDFPVRKDIKGIGLKTAREIKDLQMSLSGEKFNSLEQLKQIKRIDWDAVLAADLIRV
jgi:hypothetical protein